MNDTDPMYYFSLTDMYLVEALKQLAPETASRFHPLLCGFNPTDKSSPEQITSLFEHYPNCWRGLGEVILRKSEVTNLVEGSIPTPGSSAFELVMITAASRKVPVIIAHNATSEAPRPYRRVAYEYMPELQECLRRHPSVKVLWSGAGIYDRLQNWEGYVKHLEQIMSRHSNLYISITAQTLKDQPSAAAELTMLCEKLPDRVMLGTTTMGTFTEKYAAEIEILAAWADSLTPETRPRVIFENARRFYAEKPSLSGQTVIPTPVAHENWLTAHHVEAGPGLMQLAEAEERDMQQPMPMHLSRQGMTNGVLNQAEGKSEIKHVTIDTNLHMLDFQQKSSGTRAIMEAMDGCGAKKAVLMGLPCTKKWCRDEPDRPFDCLDDNGPCYYYPYSDQMVADAWMALPTRDRARFAPVMGGFNPTDLNAVEHVTRMYDKYPRMWRGVGKIVCRHDYITTMLEQHETPLVNHPAMKRIYQFCVEKNLPVLLHHNSDRTTEGSGDGRWEYVWEIEQVLHEFPDLKLIWSHAGISSRTFEDKHFDMLDMMLNKYPNLMADISGAVWEDIICEHGVPKKPWVALMEKHCTRFTIGSDLIGQFLGPAGNNWLRPEIEKFWVLSNHLSPAASQAILYENAQRVWFADWDIPSAEERVRVLASLRHLKAPPLPSSFLSGELPPSSL
jgi:predicted TIM-barrel fold metal-dependent hydrolase